MEFRLLMQTPHPSGRPSIPLHDSNWSLTEPLHIVSEKSDVPPYNCISYVWGSGRLPNPIHPTIQMSDRTLPAITAAIRNQDPENTTSMFWIDAFCVPTEPLAKRATLESMGFIFGRATQVIVVLSNASFAAIEQMSQPDTAKTPDAATKCLDVLESDPWMRSVWTYQEVVNSQRLLFTGEDMVGKFIHGEPFLNRFGHYLLTWQRANGYSAFDFRDKYPFLDAMENVVLDWRMASYEERSALQVMSQMDNRCSEEPSNIFYSMIGAITSKPSRRRSNPSIESLAETFMELCEDKGDYSFIYASAERDERPGYEWRPAPGMLHSTLPWTCHGEAQRGEKGPQGIRLKDMVILERSLSVAEEGRAVMLDLMVADGGESLTDTALAQHVYSKLQKLGFTGRDEYLITTRGFFYPQRAIASAPLIVLWVSANITWRVGVPGMAVVSVEGKSRYIPGVFAGSVPKEGTDVTIDFKNP